MYRGTTPTFVIELPTTIDVTNIDEAFLTFEQNGSNILEMDLSMMTVDSQANTLSVILSQEQTLSLVENAIVRYQLRFKIGGSAYATQMWQVPAERILKDGEI